MDVSIVIPVNNEAENIVPLGREIAAALGDRWDYEVIYVDDGSDDETHERLAELRRTDERVRSIRHANRCGQSAALRTGVVAATAPWIVTLDGDGQNDPADIPLFLNHPAAIESDGSVQLVAGTRRKRQDSWLKRVSSRVANAIRSRLLRDGTPDTGCGLKLIRRDVFLALPYFDHMHRFLPALVRRNGGRIELLEVSHRPRERGKSKYGVHNRLWTGIIDLLGVMWLQRRMKNPVICDEDVR